MRESVETLPSNDLVDPGMRALCGIAAYYRISADPYDLRRQLAIREGLATSTDLVRAGQQIGLKIRLASGLTKKRLSVLPTPAILKQKGGQHCVLAGRTARGLYRLVDPVTRADREISIEQLYEEMEPIAILIARKFRGPGSEPKPFGLRWFLPSIWRYRHSFTHILIASLFIQMFAIITPLFFQVIIDKVLDHKSYDTLIVLVVGLVAISLFDSLLQYLRSYALAHTTNRIDVELGQRLFFHLLRLPISYFETRSAGQTVARMRELETIRSFLTGPCMFASLDLVFAVVFVGVLFAYSWFMTLIVIASIPLYVLIAALLRPVLRSALNEKFNRGALSQQMLVETVVGAQTIKAAAAEPMMQVQWEETLAAYVSKSFDATLIGAGGQSSIQFVNKLVVAAILFFGAKSVIAGQLTIGELVAFNMIATQLTQPILRLSQIWQDFQQIRISVDRLGDILNAQGEPTPALQAVIGPIRGAIMFENVSFRYRPNLPLALKNVSFTVTPGETIGLVGRSGSGKSTLAKLIQRFYFPEEGRISVDGVDISHANPAWLRSQIAVVLQDNLLFNRTIHENIALSNPAMSRAQVMNVARLAGADEFISRLPQGYDTVVEERGVNMSGGQRQRLAIARALSTSPPILILDEATSALDYESENIIQRNMQEIARQRTVIIIAHRLQAVRRCHRIFCLDEGQIVESGTHDELLNLDGLYKQLWSLQFQQAIGQ